METTPDEIDVASLYNKILRLKSVQQLDDFHCWQLAGGKYILTCHIRTNFAEEAIDDINCLCKLP